MNRTNMAVGVGFVLSCVGVAHAQATADYGDAPPPYPSLHSDGGPYHTDVTREWIGQGVSTTTSLDSDSRQIDADFDDGRNVFGVSVDENTGETFNSFSTVVAFDPALSSAGDGTRYLNVLVDLDDNGSWDAGAEWPVQNVTLPFTEIPSGVNELTVVVGLDQDVLLNTYKGHWTRVTLSEVAVPDGSGVWGEFARGETEDFLLDEVADGDAGGSGPSLLFVWAKVAAVKRNIAVKASYNNPSGLASGYDGPGDPDGKVWFKAPVSGSKWWMEVTHKWDRKPKPNLTYEGDIRFSDPTFTLKLPGKAGIENTGKPWRGHTGITITGKVHGKFPDNNAVPKRRARTLFHYRAQIVFDPEDEWIVVSTDVDETLDQPPDAVPATSAWGTIVILLLLMAGISVKFGRRLRRQEP